MNKKDARTRRARQTRLRIAQQGATRLVVSRSNSHIYAQIVAPEGDRVLASASTVEGDVRKDVKKGGNAAESRRCSTGVPVSAHRGRFWSLQCDPE